ncbi:MAG: hypothetical protein EOP09_14885 [Proteobacteria bacterium]|nr:MAG: hypothetical protein EOP09_14885 [Pseudomonadota bacterium]
MPKQAPIEEFFSLIPEQVAAQSFHTDVACMPTPNGWVHLAIFCRVALVEPCDGANIGHDGKSLGIELVAYQSDEDGRVFDWEKRYEVQTVSEGGEVVRKLRNLMANGLARLHNYEGAMAIIEAQMADLDCFKIDWSTMPIQ